MRELFLLVGIEHSITLQLPCINFFRKSTNCIYHPCPSDGGSFLGQAVHAQALIKTDCYCTYNGCSARCIIPTRCSAFCIYKMQCNMYIPDSSQTVFTPVDVWWTLPHNTERGVWTTTTWYVIHWKFPSDTCKTLCICIWSLTVISNGNALDQNIPLSGGRLVLNMIVKI